MSSPPRTALGTIAGWRWLGSFPRRVLFFGAAIAICLVLAFFPQRYLALSTLTPTDPGSLGLGGTLGQLGATSSVFGSQAAIEVSLRVGNSQDVRDIVIQKLQLEKRLDKPPLELQRWLSRKVDVGSLRGGIIQIDMQDRDAKLARDVVAAYAEAIQNRLGQISRSQTAYKRGILEKLVREASDTLAEAQSRYDAYRLEHREAVPEAQTETVAQRIATLESSIRGKQVALAIARQMYTDENFTVRQLLAETEKMKQQLAEVRATNPADKQSVGSVVASTSVLYKLQRELSLQRSLYDSYLRFLQGTAVEDMASTANVRILEPPHIDSERQHWLPAMAMALALALIWGAVEFYRLRPPLGASIAPSVKRTGNEDHPVVHGEGHA